MLLNMQTQTNKTHQCVCDVLIPQISLETEKHIGLLQPHVLSTQI